MPAFHPETADQNDLSGRIAVVTGANSGLGLETARALAARGAHVVMACRNPQKAADAVAEIAANAPGGVEAMPLDLASLKSVEAFAAAFRDRFAALDLLINNAGVMVPPFGLTAEGFELQFGTNHLGHFALTARLCDRLLAAPRGRVVNVASLAHRAGRIDFDTLDTPPTARTYRATAAYGQSKLANLLFTLELQRRFTAAGVAATAAAAHPGWSSTNLQANLRIAELLNPLFAQSPAQGALPTLYAALMDAAAGGYFGPDGFMEMRGKGVAPAARTARAQDVSAAERLWTHSERLTGVHFDIPARRAPAAA